jgi:hypothetical protein
MSDETQIEGEDTLTSPEVQEWLHELRTHCVKVEAGQHFLNGKNEMWYDIWKGMTRAMLDRAGMHVGWWYAKYYKVKSDDKKSLMNVHRSTW